MKENIDYLIREIIQKLKADQAPDGAWHYPFETRIATDAYMIILLRTLEINDEQLIRELTERIISWQEENGAWKQFSDEQNGNITSTIEAYYALLYSGYYHADNPILKKAQQFIIMNGGIEKANMFTKVMLTITGQYKWPPFFPIPVEIILLPLSFPINFYDISVFGRANLAPLMILASKKFQMITKNSPNLSEHFNIRGDNYFDWGDTRDAKRFFSIIEKGFKSFIKSPLYFHRLAIERAKQYMLNHLESDGTFYSYYSSTFLMIFALLSLGHSKHDPIITKAIDGLKAMKCKINGHTHMQYTTASVWNTSLISYALKEAGVDATDQMLEKANQYLINHQQYKYGDWAIHSQGTLPGGWGFSHSNTINPDVDDTTASLRALAKHRIEPSWYKGVHWMYSMQNDDGGWPAFEKNVDNKLLHLLPIKGGRFLLTDESSADLTGRTLEFIGHYTKLTTHPDAIRRGKNWLLKHQEKDGSWYGRWGICYIYGTWAAISGLTAIGVKSSHPTIAKSVNWLKMIQNEDGGWGESCKSDLMEQYIPLGASNITQTSWALDALIATSHKPTDEIQRGINFILDKYDKLDWTDYYPVGQGMGGEFYIHYHSYRYIFPLLTIVHYRNKFLQ